MGILSGIVIYGLGRRRGRRQGRQQAYQSMSKPTVMEEPDCIHWYHFCKNYGSCDGMVCDYGE